MEVEGSALGASSSGMVETVHEAIFGRLLSRELSPGARLSVDQLTRDLGVSQTPVRQALVTLEAEGLVTRSHLSGYRVSPLLTREQFDELFAVRLLLEPEAARLAAQRGADSWIGAMQALEQKMADRARETGEMPYGIFARLDHELHDTISAAAGNQKLRESIQRLHSHVHLFRLLYDGDVTHDALDEHAEVSEAIAGRDPKAATSAMRRHLRRSQKRLRRAF